MNLNQYFSNSINKYYKETKSLEFLPDSRYNRKIFPTIGQYDWFEGQLLYCIIRNKKPKSIIEVSTSSGYSTLFMAMALKKNGFGVIDTYEIDRNSYLAARKNFKKFGVGKYVHTHFGDAKLLLKENIHKNDSQILFLDSLHSREFAEWFINTVVLDANGNSLVHIHDIMPTNAKVRRSGGPPWGLLNKSYYRNIAWKAKNILAGTKSQIEDINIKIRNPRNSEELHTYDGNESSEAEFVNEMVKKMNKKNYVYSFNIADKFSKLLNTKKYYNESTSNQSKNGEPMEWNASFWTNVSTLKKSSKF